MSILEALLPDAFYRSPHVGQDLLAALDDLEQRPRARPRLHVDVEEDAVELLLPARDEGRGGGAAGYDVAQAHHQVFGSRNLGYELVLLVAAVGRDCHSRDRSYSVSGCSIRPPKVYPCLSGSQWTTMAAEVEIEKDII